MKPSERKISGTDEKVELERRGQIFCFQHCTNKVFSLSRLPETCPGCATSLLTCDLDIPPFAVPSPFKSALEFPCSIVIKPTKGNFLDDYTNKSNLHIAVTDSQGEVVEYNRDGLKKDRTSDWESCLVLSLLDADPLVSDIVQDPDWGEYWDICLQETASNQSFSKETYDEEENNCFNFVLQFLTNLNQHPFTDWAKNKVDFCQRLILPKTVMAGKYIMLYRKLKQSGGMIQQ